MTGTELGDEDAIEVLRFENFMPIPDTDVGHGF
jgi:hypothetical protein